MTNKPSSSPGQKHYPPSSSAPRSTPNQHHYSLQNAAHRNPYDRYQAFLCSQIQNSPGRVEAMGQYLHQWSQDWARMSGKDDKNKDQGKPRL